MLSFYLHLRSEGIENVSTLNGSRVLQSCPVNDRKVHNLELVLARLSNFNIAMIQAESAYGGN